MKSNASDTASMETLAGDAANAVSRRGILQLATVALAQASWPAATVIAAPSAQVEAGSRVQIGLNINGNQRDIAIDTRQSLLDVLREQLDLTGTKKGCNQGACGACTVLLDGTRVLSCLTLAVMQQGVEITTIEGLAKGDELHPLQAAFIEHDGLQCGFCTPGQIMSGVACISEGHATSPEEIKSWMSGNICRCGAYPGIVAAIADAAGRT